MIVGKTAYKKYLDWASVLACPFEVRKFFQGEPKKRTATGWKEKLSPRDLTAHQRDIMTPARDETLAVWNSPTCATEIVYSMR